MVDVNTQNKTISVNVSSSGVSSNVNASGDTSHYYSEKAREWAISNRIVDGVDYSSKYYAGKANESALNAQSFAQSAQDSYNNFQDSVDSALGTVNDTVQGAITTIDTKSDEAIDNINNTKTDIITDIEFVAEGEKEEIQDLADVIKDNANTVNTAIEAGVERLNSIDSLKNNQITNCILEIPQRIKYTLENGTLTIKAGSVVIVPYGTEDLTAQYPVGATFLNDNFKVYDTQFADDKFFVWVELVNDLVDDDKTAGDNNLRLLELDLVDKKFIHYRRTSSGSADPDISDNVTNYIMYRQDLNIIKRWDMGVPVEGKVTLPICTMISNRTNGNVYDQIPQIFNGFGYIGSTVWVDKGVKGLIPNGRYEDGSLRNIEVVTSKIDILNLPDFMAGRQYAPLVLNNTGSIRASLDIASSRYYEVKNKSDIRIEDYSFWYVSSENKCYYLDGTFQIYERPLVYIGYISVNDPLQIASLNNKPPFRAVDWSDNHLPQVDGQWVNSALVLASKVACPNSDLSLDLSSWLPNDGYIYEILCDVTGRTGSTSGDTSGIAVTSDILLDNGFNVVIAQTRSASAVSFASSFTIPIGTERYLRLVNGVGANTGTFTLTARAYRRLGTNL